jgi:hypothetical protein
MNFKMKSFFTLICVCIVGGAIAQSPATKANVIARLILNEVYNIEISEGEDIQFAFNTKEDYDNGIELKDASKLSLAANSSWQVSIDTDGKEYFTASEEENNGTLPVSALGIKPSGSTEYLSLGNDSQVIFQSNTRGNSQELSLDYKASPAWDTPRDAYVIEIRYTIAAY